MSSHHTFCILVQARTFLTGRGQRFMLGTIRHSLLLISLASPRSGLPTELLPRTIRLQHCSSFAIVILAVLVPQGNFAQIQKLLILATYHVLKLPN